jgi:hypothetical protein
VAVRVGYETLLNDPNGAWSELHGGFVVTERLVVFLCVRLLRAWQQTMWTAGSGSSPR